MAGSSGTQSPNEERPTKALLFRVSGPVDSFERLDSAKQGAGIPVQFNPSTLKVSMANALSTNEKPKNNSATQYLDKSSASLSVELIFDTTLEDTDVRLKTQALAEAFMKPTQKGKKLVAPNRCLFQWGSFAFVGLMQSLDETLDFFSPTGTPLRASVSLKLAEDRYQFLTGTAQRAAREQPSFAPSGTGAPPPGPDGDPKGWRDTALYNGIESPRLPGGEALAVPALSAGASAGVSLGGGLDAGIGGGIGLGAGLSAGIGGGISGSLSDGLGVNLKTELKADLGPPGFSYGASAALGTSIPGAFSAALVSSTTPLTVTAGLSGGAVAGLSLGADAGLRIDASGSLGASGGAFAGASASVSASGSGSAGASASGSVGFD